MGWHVRCSGPHCCGNASICGWVDWAGRPGIPSTVPWTSCKNSWRHVFDDCVQCKGWWNPTSPARCHSHAWTGASTDWEAVACSMFQQMLWYVHLLRKILINFMGYKLYGFLQDYMMPIKSKSAVRCLHSLLPGFVRSSWRSPVGCSWLRTSLLLTALLQACKRIWLFQRRLELVWNMFRFKSHKLFKHWKPTGFTASSSSLQVAFADLHTVLYIDCTKLGVLNQMDINMVGTLTEKVLSSNPQRPSVFDIYKLSYIYDLYIYIYHISIYINYTII